MPSVARVRAYYIPLAAAAAKRFGAAALGGRLLLVDGLADEGDALLIAAGIAGAASLALETRADAVRYCVRNGIVDFAVNALDEALRILKNEIRKKQPIAVLLEKAPDEALAEMLERGAQPEMLRWASADEAIAAMKKRGASLIPPPLAADPDAEREVCWRAGDGGSAVLRQLDRLAAETLPPDDLARQNWIARAPRYLPRALRMERCVFMSAAERSAFVARVEEHARQGEWPVRVEIESGGQRKNYG